MPTTINPSDQTITQYNIQTGGANNLLNNVAPSSTSGVPVISQGTSSQPVFGTALVAGGGTGQVTLTNHGVLVGAGTSAITQLATGSSGQILQSGGASADPSYSTATYPSTAGTSGNFLKSDGTNWSSQSLQSSNIFFVQGSINSTTFKTIHTTPVQIVAAPGSGKFIYPISFYMYFKYGGTNVFTTGGSLGFVYNNSSTNFLVWTTTTGTYTGTASSITVSGFTGANNTTDGTNLNNYALSFTTSSSDPGGNAANDNIIYYTLWYSILPALF